MSGRRIAPAQPGYAWILDVLLGETPALTWAASTPPADFEVTERFAVLPATTGRAFLVSLNARRGAAAAVTSYNSLRSARWRIPRTALGLGLRAGLAQPLLPGKVDVGRAVGAPEEQLADALLSQRLRERFGRGPVVVAVSGGDGPYRKPVVQVFSAQGTPLGFIKVGWNDWTRDAVRREAAALRACASRQLRFGVPALLDHYVRGGLEFLATEPLPPRLRRIRNMSRLPDVGVLREISRLSEPCTGQLATSPWWLGLRTRIATGVADPDTRSELDAKCDLIERSDGQTTLEFGTWHGDFVPWNLAWHGKRLLAWDWESSAAQAPLGFDAVHFHFQVAFVARRLPLEQAARTAAREARPALEALGVAPAAHQLVAALHLLELSARHAEATSSTGRLDERFYPAVTRVLSQSLPASRGLGPVHSGRPS